MAHPFAGVTHPGLAGSRRAGRFRTGLAVDRGSVAVKKARPGIKIRLGRLLAVLFVAYGLFLFARQELGMYQLRVQETRIRNEITQLQQENQALSEQIKFMQSDEYIEKAAREQLGLVKEGEIPYYNGVPGDPGSAGQGSGY